MKLSADEINRLLDNAAESPVQTVAASAPTPSPARLRVVNLCHEELVAANEVLDAVAAAGVAIEAVAGRIRLSPPSAVDAALRARVAAHRAGILSLLATRPDAATVWRLAVEKVAESLKLPPDVLAAAKAARVRWVPPARLKDQ